jgi:hypothetical protein
MIESGFEGGVAQGSSNRRVPITMAEAPPNTTILPGESRWSWRNHGGENRFTEDRREKPTRPDIFMFRERVKSEGSRAR